MYFAIFRYCKHAVIPLVEGKWENTRIQGNFVHLCKIGSLDKCDIIAISDCKHGLGFVNDNGITKSNEVD